MKTKTSKNNKITEVLTWLNKRGYPYAVITGRDAGRGYLKIILNTSHIEGLYDEYRLPIEVLNRGLKAVKRHLAESIRSREERALSASKMMVQARKARMKTCTDFLKD